MFDPLTLNCHSVVNKFTVCMKSVQFFDEQIDEQMFLPIRIDEIGKNQDKSINETSVSSISTRIDRYNRYQSNQMYRFLLIYRFSNRYRFLSIDYSGC